MTCAILRDGLYASAARGTTMDDASEFQRIVAGCVGDPGACNALLKDAVGT